MIDLARLLFRDDNSPSQEQIKRFNTLLFPSPPHRSPTIALGRQ